MGLATFMDVLLLRFCVRVKFGSGTDKGNGGVSLLGVHVCAVDKGLIGAFFASVTNDEVCKFE